MSSYVSITDLLSELMRYPMSEHLAPERIPWHTLSLCVLTLIFFGLTSDRAAVFFLLIADNSTHDIWRIITAHLVHTDTIHLGANVAALAILGTLVEKHSVQGFWMALVSGVSGVELWFFLQSDADYYCGLSGVLCALLSVTTILLYDRAHPWHHHRSGNLTLVVIGLVVFTKIVVELATPIRLLTGTTWPSAPGAHASGFVSGLILMLLSATSSFGNQPRANRT